jgi:hypothetical protein
MQGNRIGIDGSAGARVRGLGVCDVLRVELAAAQVPGLIAELEELRGPLEEERLRAVGVLDRSAPDSAVAERDVDEVEHRLACLRGMRAQLPRSDAAAPVVLVGPAELVIETARGAARNAADELAEALRSAHEPEAIRARAAVALAWVETWMDCRTVESFAFEPGGEPPD